MTERTLNPTDEALKSSQEVDSCSSGMPIEEPTPEPKPQSKCASLRFPDTSRRRKSLTEIGGDNVRGHARAAAHLKGSKRPPPRPFATCSPKRNCSSFVR